MYLLMLSLRGGSRAHGILIKRSSPRVGILILHDVPRVGILILCDPHSGEIWRDHHLAFLLNLENTHKAFGWASHVRVMAEQKVSDTSILLLLMHHTSAHQLSMFEALEHIRLFVKLLKPQL